MDISQSLGTTAYMLRLSKHRGLIAITWFVWESCHIMVSRVWLYHSGLAVFSYEYSGGIWLVVGLPFPIFNNITYYKHVQVITDSIPYNWQVRPSQLCQIHDNSRVTSDAKFCFISDFIALYKRCSDNSAHIIHPTARSKSSATNETSTKWTIPGNRRRYRFDGHRLNKNNRQKYDFEYE